MLRCKGVAETKPPWSHPTEGLGQGKAGLVLGPKVFLEATDLRQSSSGFPQETNELAKNSTTNKSSRRAIKKLLLRPATYYISRSPLTSFSICCSPVLIQCVLFRRGVCQMGEKEVGCSFPAPSCDGQVLVISACLTLLALVPYPPSPQMNPLGQS